MPQNSQTCDCIKSLLQNKETSDETCRLFEVQMTFYFDANHESDLSKT
jgi:hypothetical protein